MTAPTTKKKSPIARTHLRPIRSANVPPPRAPMRAPTDVPAETHLCKASRVSATFRSTEMANLLFLLVTEEMAQVILDGDKGRGDDAGVIPEAETRDGGGEGQELHKAGQLEDSAVSRTQVRRRVVGPPSLTSRRP